MEKLKKIILQAVTTGITACTGTTGTCHVIIPDTGATYFMKIGLKQEAQDIGVFDVSGTTYVPPTPPPVDNLVVETGTAIAKPIAVSIRTVSNKLITEGETPVIEYGTVYTCGSNNNESTLIIGSTDVQQVSTCGNIVVGQTYGDIFTDLVAQTEYHYRAFAIDNTNTAYGEISCATTGGFIPFVPKIQVDLYWDDTRHDGPDDGMMGSLKLYKEGASFPTQSIYIPEPSTDHSICFTNLDLGQKYNVCLNGICALINNVPNYSVQTCWCKTGSSTPNYELCIPDAEIGCNYSVSVKCGIPR